MSEIPQQQGTFPSPDEDPTNPVRVAILQAITMNAAMAGGSTEVDARDSKDHAQAALFLAQAYISLDPSRLQGGETPETARAAAPPTFSDHDHDGKVDE